MTPEQAAALRAPFAPEQIGKLPKGGVQLDYVGHAATTDRLLQVDPEWSWEPFALTEDGLPALDDMGNLWIRLTVCGTTRPGVGDGKNMKERIGDAIRNAAMRFGVALDLWAKEDLTPVEKPRVDMHDPNIPFGDAPVPGVNQPPAKKATEPQKKKLNVLVAQLRDEGQHITTEHLYAAVAEKRGVHPGVLVLDVGGLDDEKVLRWRYLRDALTRDEARELIDRLELKAEQIRKPSPFQVPAGVQVPLDG